MELKQIFDDLGNYPLATDNGSAYNRQRDVMKKAIETYGTDHIAGVTVGNEFMAAKYVFLALFHYFATYCRFKVPH